MNRVIAILLLFFYTSAIFAQTAPATSGTVVAPVVTEESTVTQDLEVVDAVGSHSVDLAMSSADYMVTAGDVYTLSFAAGNTPISYTIPVDSSYRVRVANLAVLDATGMSFVKLKKQVEDIVIKNYPLSAVQFVLLNPATFKVRLVGEVNSATEKTAWALTRLSSVLGGSLTEYSSRRTITITSQSGEVKKCDLFLASRFGDLSQNPYLRPGDVITIGRAERFVTIDGSVERPGRYELLEGDNMKQLVEYYGNGLTPFADPSRIVVKRHNGFETGIDKIGKTLYWTEDAIAEDEELFHYDSVTIAFYSDFKPVMFVEGADSSVAKTAITFTPGINYATFVKNNASWFTEETDKDGVYIQRGEEIIPLDVRSILYEGNFGVDILVQADDVLCIPLKPFFITVSGSVHVPGQYPYAPNKTYEYYIALAGGFNMAENMGSAVEIVDGDGNKIKRTEIIEPGSSIRAKTNDFMYNFNKYVPIISLTATVITATIAILNFVYDRGN